ncbi:MAG: hypothetical protein HRU75_07330 [Planctomycetia bacterium]|nr:MAG: hypothetical protein HRU75_07330 [Planctomycetia bacterium]
MRYSHRHFLTSAPALVATILVVSGAHAADILPIGTTGTWTDTTSARGLSADGSTVVGTASSATGDVRPFLWKPTVGDIWIHNGQPTWYYTEGLAINANGTVAVGAGYDGNYQRQWRWTQASNVLTDIGNLCNCAGAYATGVSADGSVVAGYSAAPGFHATRWTSATGLVNLGTAGMIESIARGITPDGTAIVGHGLVTAIGLRGFIRYGDGTWVQLQPNNAGEGTIALAVGSTPNMVAGYSGSEATRWESEVPMPLGILFGESSSVATAIHATGDVVGGHSGGNLVPQSNNNGGWIWTQTRGMVRLSDFLASQGVDITGWSHLDGVSGFSQNGTVLIGNGVYNGKARGFMVRGLDPLCGPWIDIQPEDTTVCHLGQFTLSVQAFGPTFHPPLFQWERWNDSFWVPLQNITYGTGTTISGANSPTMTVWNSSSVDVPGAYRCVMTAGCSSKATNTVMVGMVFSPPSFQDDGIAPKACSHGGAAMTVYPGPLGNGPFTYQWQREHFPNSNTWTNLSNGTTLFWDGNNPGVGGMIGGANTATLIIVADVANTRQLAKVHQRGYRCVVTNACGSNTFAKSLTVFLSGDTNCDDSINSFDIDPFVEWINAGNVATAPAGYLALNATQACWDQRGCWGDVNHDGFANNFDIDPFVGCVLNAPPAGQACP